VPVPVLQLLHGAVQRANELRQELAGIVFVNGPGGFTSLRTGLAVAQTLAYAWKLPIVHAPSEAKSEILRSIAMRAKAHRLAYGRAPSITKPKVRPRPKRALR
jgi:tRNA A37 threonylcarbamoyladenosine modification protein TsaB